jgi:cytochrome b561
MQPDNIKTMWRNTEQYYGHIAKFFHWLIAVLVLLMLLVGYFMDDITDKALRSTVYSLHKTTGIAILFLVLFRLLWALTNNKPLLPKGTPYWQILAEKFAHVCLYVSLIIMPLSGWVMSVAAGYAPRIGKYALYLPIPVNKVLSGNAFTVHAWLALALAILIAMHVGAAFYHHFIKKDNVLRRMWWGKQA